MEGEGRHSKQGGAEQQEAEVAVTLRFTFTPSLSALCTA